MRTTILCASLAALAACAVFGQTAANPPQFEVASIKPAAPQPAGRTMVSMGGDAGRLSYTNVSLRDIIRRAYEVKPYQISGPAWLNSERFDILAKIPDGAPKEQIPVMLQNLLAERFRMVVRRETKEQPVYALVVAKGGPKLTKAADEPLPEPKQDAAAPPPPPPLPPGAGGGHVTPKDMPKGAVMISLNSADGASKMALRGATMGSFSDMLSNILDRPVVDMTGLSGSYDISLEAGMDELAGMGFMIAPGPGAQHAGSGAGAATPTPAPSSAPSASIFTSIQQLGLKLEPRKAPIEYIVIERAEKVPTEN
jgi:uncharacterized protein (TIGR03435 family)